MNEKAKWRRRIQSSQRRLQIQGKFKSAAISQYEHTHAYRIWKCAFSTHTHSLSPNIISLNCNGITFNFVSVFSFIKFQVIWKRIEARKIIMNTTDSITEIENMLYGDVRVCVFVLKCVVMWSFNDRWHTIHTELNWFCMQPSSFGVAFVCIVQFELGLLLIKNVYTAFTRCSW